MDFSAWSPSHSILVAVVIIGFIGQVAILFYRMGQQEKRMDRGEERAEKRDAELLAMFDKRLGEVNQRIDGLRSEMNQRLSDMTSEISKLNQNHIDHLTHHER